MIIGCVIVKLKNNRENFGKNIKATYQKPRENANSLTLDDLHDYFKTMFGEAPTGHHFYENTFNETQSKDEHDELDSSFTETELRKVIFSLHNNKSPGLDSLTSEILKSAYDFISTFLLSLYNRMFNTGEYPRA